MGGSSSGSGSSSGGGSSRNTSYATFPSGKRVAYNPNPIIRTSSGRPVRTSSGGFVRAGGGNNNRDNDRGGGGGGNNNPAPMPPPISQIPVPPPTETPETGVGSGKVINPTVFLLQREQRNRRLGRNYFSLLGVSEQFTGARRNILF